jgi:hypothetical protein
LIFRELNLRSNHGYSMISPNAQHDYSAHPVGSSERVAASLSAILPASAMSSG